MAREGTEAVFGVSVAGEVSGGIIRSLFHRSIA